MKACGRDKSSPMNYTRSTVCKLLVAPVKTRWDTVDSHKYAAMHSDLGIPADSFLDLAISMTSPSQDEAALCFVLTVHTRA